MLGGQPQASVAVIVSNARQASYHPGDALPGAGNIVLDSIAADHVIVDNNGRKEALWLDASPASNRTGTGRSAPTPPPGAVPLEITGVLGGRTAEGLPVVAATLSEIIKVQPAQENGQLIGYRLSPGEKLREFVQLGLETNDVVTQVNGLALNDMANMPKLYALMNEATEVSFLLLREGKPMTLQFALTDAR
jgi:general secretion pathway protein C